ncbi:DEAD/DEAH box helicase family protein [Microbacterium sp. NPDC076895]|uniref:DEAD/DEAH box helicase n=1 Tax=Microbacterium sp. NPDC076895 TaxID=3154957 RepID=UPI0034384ECE
MRYTLKDYQADAVGAVLRNLEQAKDMYHRYGSRSQFSLSAVTGAGKTVMAAAVIEALIFGSDEFDFPADPGAVVLWFSDDPALNEQSRDRIRAAASELDWRLKLITNDFREPIFERGNVYFLNTQKLSKSSNLVKGAGARLEPENMLASMEPRPDDVQSNIYDTIINTIEDKERTLYLVLDEAHRGMKPQRDRATIVQRLINGQGLVPAIPVVLGISATVERFETAMKSVTGRTALPSVQVDSALVQASGLLKDDIVLSIPAEAGAFDTALLRRAVEKTKAATTEWNAYTIEQGEANPVVPLLVVQMADKPSDDVLVRTLDTIFEAWPELGGEGVANVFGEHQDLQISGYAVPYIEPQRVQDSTHVRVLLAKSAISTGWDCPRAEVLVSFRPGTDPTHITQLLGRMIRTPLARRIPGNELLNSVDCMLPYFDRETAKRVAEMLMQGATAKDDEGESGGGEGRRVLFDPVPLLPNATLPQEVWEKFESLPTVTIPKQRSKPIKRFTALAAALTKDKVVDQAVKRANDEICRVVESRATQYKEQVDAARQDVLTLSGEELRTRLGGGQFVSSSFELTADTRAIIEAYKLASRSLSPALCSAYVDYLVPDDAIEDDLLEAYIEVAAIGLVPDVVQSVEAEADRLAQKWLTDTRVDRKNLSDEQQAEYDRLEGMSTEPERVSLVSPKTGQAETKLREADGTETLLPVNTAHLMVAEDGTFPLDLNKWETDVLNAESKRNGFVAWWRNPDRAVKESLAIAYTDASQKWKALRPDFIFFAQGQNGIVVDLVDPHGHHLADAMPKLRGLAQFTEAFGSEFRRIESVAETNGAYRVLDLKRDQVREAIRTTHDAKALYESDLASDYL